MSAGLEKHPQCCQRKKNKFVPSKFLLELIIMNHEHTHMYHVHISLHYIHEMYIYNHECINTEDHIHIYHDIQSHIHDIMMSKYQNFCCIFLNVYKTNGWMYTTAEVSWKILFILRYYHIVLKTGNLNALNCLSQGFNKCK